MKNFINYLHKSLQKTLLQRERLKIFHRWFFPFINFATSLGNPEIWLVTILLPRWTFSDICPGKTFFMW